MPENLPRFAYHPDPVATGVIESSDATCECCGLARGFRYTASIYGERDIEVLCPWCIADGRASAELGASFSASYPLSEAGMSEDVVREVTERTPGHVSWQQESWLTCCGDACAFHGDAATADLRGMAAEGLTDLSASSGFSVERLQSFFDSYEPGGDPAFYKFVCRHCSGVLYCCDYS